MAICLEISGYIICSQYCSVEAHTEEEKCAKLLIKN
jgi:hypothetical protein